MPLPGRTDSRTTQTQRRTISDMTVQKQPNPKRTKQMPSNKRRSGVFHKEPAYESPEHRAWYETTSKRVLYELLRDAEIQLTGQDNTEAWLPNAKYRQEILKWNKII